MGTNKKIADRMADLWPTSFERREGQTVFKDPRADIGGIEESFMWAWLISSAWDKSKELAGTLHGFRVYGCRLEKSENGWRINPGADWQEGEYAAAREKYLVPHKNLLMQLLREL